jgi:hypothetical protein
MTRALVLLACCLAGCAATYRPDEITLRLTEEAAREQRPRPGAQRRAPVKPPSTRRARTDRAGPSVSE